MFDNRLTPRGFQKYMKFPMLVLTIVTVEYVTSRQTELGHTLDCLRLQVLQGSVRNGRASPWAVPNRCDPDFLMEPVPE